MQLLSVRQPWAWAIARGRKQVENRTWAPSYRGPVAIYASMRVDLDAAESPLLWFAGWDPDDPVAAIGGIVAIVTLADVCSAAVDGERCRYPSCTRRRKLHAHHVIEWIAGGRTDLANMVLLCSRHHHAVIHAGRFHLTLHPTSRALTITTTAGIPVPHRHQWPWQPAEHLDPDHSIDATTLPPYFAGDKLDLHYAIDVLMQHAA